MTAVIILTSCGIILDTIVNVDDDVKNEQVERTEMVGVRQFDEDEVVATALDVFWRKGLHDATMQDLAAATGVQRGSLYNAYGDKEAIFLRAFDRYAEQFLEAAGNALAQGDAASGLKNFFDMIIVNMTDGSPPRGCLTTRTALDAAISSTDVRQRVQGVLTRLEQLIGKAISGAPGKRSVTDANRLARVIVTFTRGLAVMERAGYSRKQLRESATTFIEAVVGNA
ncbi:TetR/AcrR family transcriptional regulator [Bradyrhizobium sp. Pear76]|uniref:TetR/AcrR family transcriptional regulator n=1 Tax=Bradyrhizobium oropedii TaxID=1571201 RepID=UPI0030846456|nr:TetR/AcrR family transcriptional regulator [Bradyrhizobium oropedii]